MGLLDYAAAAITPATQVAGAYQGAQASAAEQQRNMLLQTAMMARQQQQLAVEDALKKAQTRHFDVQSQLLQNPVVKPKSIPAKFTVNGKEMQGSMDETGQYHDAFGNGVTPDQGDVAPFVPPKADPRPLAGANGFVDPKTLKPLTGPDGKVIMPASTVVGNIITSGVGPDGKPYVATAKNKGDPNVTLSGVEKPQAGGKGAGANSGAQTSLMDLIRTHHALKADEDDPKFDLGFTQQAMEGAAYGISHAQTAGKEPSKLNLLIAAATKPLGGMDERQATYVRNGRFYGEDVSQALKGRTNEERVQRDVATGKLDYSNVKMPRMKQTVQERRENMLAMAAMAQPDQFAKLPAGAKAEIESYIAKVPPDMMAAYNLTPPGATQAGAPAGSVAAQHPAPAGSVRLGGGTVQPQQGNAPPGNVNLGAPKTPAVKLTPAQIQKAAVDPAYKQFLISTGKLPAGGE